MPLRTTVRSEHVSCLKFGLSHDLSRRGRRDAGLDVNTPTQGQPAHRCAGRVEEPPTSGRAKPASPEPGGSGLMHKRRSVRPTSVATVVVLCCRSVRPSESGARDFADQGRRHDGRVPTRFGRVWSLRRWRCRGGVARGARPRTGRVPIAAVAASRHRPQPDSVDVSGPQRSACCADSAVWPFRSRSVGSLPSVGLLPVVHG